MMAKRKAKKSKKAKKRKVSRRPKKKEDKSGLWIPVGILIGVGVGFAINQLVAATLIGLGAGVVLTVLTKMLKK